MSFFEVPRWRCIKKFCLTCITLYISKIRVVHVKKLIDVVIVSGERQQSAEEMTAAPKSAEETWVSHVRTNDGKPHDMKVSVCRVDHQLSCRAM